jgi:hypothetical protein
MLMGEDLVYGVGASLIGQGAGGMRGARKYKRMSDGGKKPVMIKDRVKGPDGKMVESSRPITEGEMIDRNMGYGDMMAMPAMAFLPRPLAQGVYEAAGERANQTAQEIASAEQAMNEQQIAASSFAAAERALLQAMYGVGA